MDKETSVESTGKRKRKRKRTTSNFCHYTIDNVSEETKKVAPSGSSKTRKRRKKEQEERRRKKQDTRRVFEAVDRNFKVLVRTFVALKECMAKEEQNEEAY